MDINVSGRGSAPIGGAGETPNINIGGLTVEAAKKTSPTPCFPTHEVPFKEVPITSIEAK